MGKQSGRLASNRRRKGKSWFWSGHQIFLFLVLISVFALVRIFSVFGIVSPIVCDHIEQTALASEYSLLDGPMDMAFWVGLAGVSLVLAYGVHGLFTRAKPSFSAVALGVTNFMAALGLMAYAAFYWAYFYPEKPGAAAVLRIASMALDDYNLVQLESRGFKYDIRQTWLSSDYGWTRISDDFYRHQSGVTARYKRTVFCFSGEDRSRRMDLLGFDPYPAQPGDRQTNEIFRKDWVFYDATGRMMLYPKQWYHTVDPMFFQELQKAFENPSPIGARDYYASFEIQYAADREAERLDKVVPLSIEDYQEIVERAWESVEKTAEP